MAQGTFRPAEVGTDEVARLGASPGSVYSSMLLTSTVRALAAGLHGPVLDVGCGRQPYRDLFAGQPYVGLDWPGSPHGTPPSAYADAARLPVRSAAFGTVLCTEVLEHLRDPRAGAVELARVLRPGGTLVLSVPFVYPLHELPHDHHRFTPGGIAADLADAGFEVEAVHPRGGWGSVWFDLTVKQARRGLLQGLAALRVPAPAQERVSRAVLVAPQRALARRALARGATAAVQGVGSVHDVSLGYVVRAVRV